MSKSKAQTLTLAGTLCHDLDDSSSISTFFDDTIDEIAFFPTPPFIKYAADVIANGTATHPFESDQIRSYLYFHDDHQLIRSTERDLESYSTTWRTDTGTPIAFTDELQDSQTRLFPVPNSGGSLYKYYAQDKSSSIQEYYAIPIALRTLSKEFAYHSKHQDLVYSELCDQIATLIFKLLGH